MYAIGGLYIIIIIVVGGVLLGGAFYSLYAPIAIYNRITNQTETKDEAFSIWLGIVVWPVLAFYLAEGALRWPELGMYVWWVWPLLVIVFTVVYTVTYAANQ